MKGVMFILIIVLLLPFVYSEDFDGIPDDYEITYGLDVNFDDSALDLDKDGLSNINESIINTKANDPDSDGDGFSDGYEFFRGKDPLNELNHPINPMMMFLTTTGIVTLLMIIVFFSSFFYYRNNVDHVSLSKFIFVIEYSLYKKAYNFYQKVYPHETKEQKEVKTMKIELERKRTHLREEMIKKELAKKKHEMYQRKIQRRFSSKKGLFNEFRK